MSLELVVVAAVGFIAGATVCWCVRPSATRPAATAPVGLSKSERILDHLTAELQAKGLAKVDRDADGQVRRVRWAGEGGVGNIGEGSHLSRSSSREPDADQGPQI